MYEPDRRALVLNHVCMDMNLTECIEEAPKTNHQRATFSHIRNTITADNLITDLSAKSFFPAKLSNIHWFQFLNHEELLLFFGLCDSYLNMFGF